MTMKLTIFISILLICSWGKAQNIIADFTISSSCINNAICFTDLSTSNNGQITTWNWIFADGTTSSAQHPCHTYAFPATYTVTLIVTNINGDQDAISFPINAVVCTAVSENEAENNIMFYPNPTSGSLMIKGSSAIQKVELINIAGQILLSETVNQTSYQLQLQNFSEGIYFVKVLYANGMSVTKKAIKL